MRLVKIVWHDSGMTHESGWRTSAQVENRTPLVISVGFTVHEDEENMTIAQGYSAELGLYYGMHTIWKRSIEKIVECA